MPHRCRPPVSLSARRRGVCVARESREVRGWSQSTLDSSLEVFTTCQVGAGYLNAYEAVRSVQRALAALVGSSAVFVRTSTWLRPFLRRPAGGDHMEAS